MYVECLASSTKSGRKKACILLTDAFMDVHSIPRNQHEIDKEVFEEKLVEHRWRVFLITY